MRTTVEIAKVDDRLGIVFGYGVICEKRDATGQLAPFVDVQGDFVDPRGMLEASADFMAGDRDSLVMHEGEPAGQVVFGFPLTSDIAAALGVSIEKTGFIVGIRPRADVMDRVRSGELRAFSIGGSVLDAEEITQ